MTKPSSEFISKRIPLYYQLENLLREKILSGAFAAGSKLPTESELIRQYGVGRVTVRQALATLAEDGLIERRQGRGTFVTERKTRRRALEGRVDLTCSLDQIITPGSGEQAVIIEMNRVDADSQEADLLSVAPGEPIYRIKCLGMREDRPYSLTLSYLPAEIGENLTREELSHGSSLQLIETKFGLKLQSAKQRIYAALADPYLAKLLNVRVGAPLLSIERTAYASDGRPMEFVHSLYGAELYSYVISFARQEDSPRKPEVKKRKR